jgi:hypothetical protein
VLFVLVKTAMPDRVPDEVKGTGGKILKISLSHDDINAHQISPALHLNGSVPISSLLRGAQCRLKTAAATESSRAVGGRSC